MFKYTFNAYLEFWLKATDFKGTTTRLDWWLVQLVNIIVTFLTIPIFLRTLVLMFMELFAFSLK